MSTDEKLNVTLEWAGDIPYQLIVGIEIIWRNEKILVDILNVLEETVTLPKVRAIKYARIVLAGLQAGTFIAIGERLKEQTEKLLAQQEAFRKEVIKFGTERMIEDAKNQAHRPIDCPRCDICERESCEGCDIAELCTDMSCTNCPEKDGCWAIASGDPFYVSDDENDDDDEDDDDDDNDDDDDDDDDNYDDWCSDEGEDDDDDFQEA